MFMNKDQNLINEFAIKTLKENLNVMYAQIWREGQLTDRKASCRERV